MKTLIVAIWLCGAAAGQTPAEIDQVFAPLVSSNQPGAAVLVRKNGKVVFARGYGVRDLRTRAPIDARTDFRLASVTKQFTAMTIMLLVHDGKLRYDTRLTDIFPDFPDYGRAITIRHLLTHTSGLPDYGELMQSGPWTETRQIIDIEVLDLIRRAPPKFAAGASWEYSNSGYVVLGLIVAKASGMPFGDFLHARIFAPLHMSGTLVYVKGKNTVPRRAFGHSKQDGALVETDQSASSATQGDGGIYSNVEDIAKWDEALERHTLLSEAEMGPALEPVRLADGSEPRTQGQPVAYGFGWFLDALDGRARMYHAGSTRGFLTAIERFPTERLTVVVLCNRTDLDAAKLAVLAVEVADKAR